MRIEPVTVTDEQMVTLLEAAEAIVDGWYSEGRIDWDDFLDRLEDRIEIDLGGDLMAPHIIKIKQHALSYRRLE